MPQTVVYCKPIAPITTSFYLTLLRFEHIITNCKQTKKPEETGGGILADEMGLGKTLTMLCAIIRTFDEAKEFPQLVYDQIHLTAECPLTPSRATLVVVPSSCKSSRHLWSYKEVLNYLVLLHEWKHEIELWVWMFFKGSSRLDWLEQTLLWILQHQFLSWSRTCGEPKTSCWFGYRAQHVSYNCTRGSRHNKPFVANQVV